MKTDLQVVSELPDVQSTRDHREIAIPKVGVTNIRYPMIFQSSSHALAEGLGEKGSDPSLANGQASLRMGSQLKIQHTIANVSMFVSLAKHERGTHMSRFMQVLREIDGPVSLPSLLDVCEQIRHRLRAQAAYLQLRFPYFVDKQAPVSGEHGKLDLDVSIDISCNEKTDYTLTLAVPATSLCPCSKQISSFGAHNQRCELIASVKFAPLRWIAIEELVQMIELSASAELFATLKRSDEKWVTERAYENPRFVEDIVRELASTFNKDDRIQWYKCSSENFESIHSHNAFAEIELDKIAK